MKVAAGYIEERFLDCACRHPSQQTRRMKEKNRQAPLGMTARWTPSKSKPRWQVKQAMWWRVLQSGTCYCPAINSGDEGLRPLPFSGGPTYATIFWCAYGLWCALEIIGLLFTTGRSRRGRKASDKGSSGVLVLFTWLAIGLDFVLCFRFPQAAIRWERTSIFFIGIALMLAGTAFRFYAMWVLGRSFTYYVAVHDKQTVVEVGPYHYIRHPSYTGALIIFFGLGLALGNWAGLLALLTGVGIAYGYRISVEESVLAATLGEPYQAYMRRTRRLVPFLF